MAAPARMTLALARPVVRPAARRRFGIAAAIALALGGAAAGAAPAEAPSAPPIAALAARPAPVELTAEQIVQRNVAARGGLETWRKVEAMGWIGRLESPTSQMPMLPFVLEQKRPNKTHFEINQMGEKSLRIFDGKRGWRVRPGGNGSTDVKPFTADEIKYAKDEPGMDGPLIDYQAKGSTIALAGIEDVEGRKNYRISVRLASGERSDVWIDAQTFLESKFDRTTYSQKGVPGTVSVMYRDYKTIDGVTIPTEMDIGVGSARAPDKMIIDKVAVNPPLDDKEFTRPGGMRRKRMAIVDIDTPPGTPGGPMAQPPAPNAVPGNGSAQK